MSEHRPLFSQDEIDDISDVLQGRTVDSRRWGIGREAMDTNVTLVMICKGASEEFDQPEAWYFNGKAANGEIVVTSEMYTSKDHAKRAAGDVFPGIEQKEESEES